MPFDATPTEVTPAELAAQMIERGIERISNPRHWLKRCFCYPMSFGAEEMAYCAIGSLGLVTRDDMSGALHDTFDVANPAHCLAYTTLDRVAPHRGGMVSFNDDPDTKHSDVIRVMRIAVDVLRSDNPSQFLAFRIG